MIEIRGVCSPKYYMYNSTMCSMIFSQAFDMVDTRLVILEKYLHVRH